VAWYAWTRRFDVTSFYTRFYELTDVGSQVEHQFDPSNRNDFDPRRHSFEQWGLAYWRLSYGLFACAICLIVWKLPPRLISFQSREQLLTRRCLPYRIAGIGSLLLALVFTAGWIGSLTNRDELKIDDGFASYLRLVSLGQSLICSRGSSWEYVRWLPDARWREGHTWKDDQLPSIHWESESVRDGTIEEVEQSPDFPGDHGVQFMGFDLGRMSGRIMLTGNWAEISYSIPYWSLVFPLTLVSALFLFWQPRKCCLSADATKE